MSSRVWTALAVSMVIHTALWVGVFSRGPLTSQPIRARFDNSVLIDPTAIEAVRKARAAKPAPAASPVKVKKLPAPVAATTTKKAPVKASASAALPKIAEPKAEIAPSEKTPLIKTAPTKAAVVGAGPASSVSAKTSGDLMANPKTRGLFADYFGLVKARIQEKLREKCEGQKMGRGSIDLAFILQSDGRLQKVYVIDRRAETSPELKALAIESLKEAAPFKDFPVDFNARQIAFNLTVYFEDL